MTIYEITNWQLALFGLVLAQIGALIGVWAICIFMSTKKESPRKEPD